MMKRFFIATILLLCGGFASAQTISNVRPLTATATLSAADAGTCSAETTACAVLLLGGYSSISVQVTGNASANTLQFESTLDAIPSASSVWVAVNMTPPNSVTAVTSTTSTGLWTGAVNAAAFRVRVSTFVGGTAVVAMRATIGSFVYNWGGAFSSPLVAPAANNCATVPYTFSGDTNTGLCSSAADSVSLSAGGSAILTATASAVTSTVPYLAPDGAVGAPSYSFAGQPTLGIYSGASEIAFAVGGVKTFAFDSNNFYLLSNTAAIQFGASQDLSLSRLAADRFGQVRSTNAQRADWCNTFTSLSSYECASADWQTQANVFMFGTRTAATGTGRLLNLAAQFDNAADSYTSIRMNASTLPVLKAGYLTAAGGNVSTGATGTWFSWGNVTHTNSSGVVWNTKIEPTVNQSGTAGYTASGGNVTETATGSGAKLLIDWRVNDVSQFSVSNTGSIIAAGSATLSAGGTFGLSGRNGWSSRALGLSDTTTTDGVFGIQINTGTAAPTFNNGTVTTGSRNTAGQITLTGANTGGVITFGAPAWTNAPFCTLTGSAATDTAHITAVTTTTLTIAGMTANGVFTYTCIGRI